MRTADDITLNGMSEPTPPEPSPPGEPAETPEQDGPPAEPRQRRTWSTRTLVAATIVAVVLSAGAGAAVATWSQDDGSRSAGHGGGMPGGFNGQHGQFHGPQPGQQPGQPLQPGLPPQSRDDTDEPDAQGD
jgi:hypothetical protein